MLSIIVDRLGKLESEGNEEKLNYLRTENESFKRDIERYPIKLQPGEKIICVMFKKQEDNKYYSIICKTNEKFETIKNRFYEKNPIFKKLPKISFKFQGHIIDNESQSLEKLGINHNSIIELNDK